MADKDEDKDRAAWKEALEKALSGPLLRRELSRLVYGGFDSYQDYFRYGGLFLPTVPREQIPPEDRKFYTPPPDPGR